MKRGFICLIILFLAGSAVEVRSQQGKGKRKKPLMAELTVHPAKAAQPAKKYQLLVKADEQSEADAMGLYEKAAKSLPENINRKQLKQWSDTPPDKLPIKQVEKTLQRFKASLGLVEQASRCGKCQWPEEDKHEENLSSYRNLAYVLALQARLKIAEGKYDEAIGVMQTGLTMGSHIGQGPILIHGLVGVAISALMVRQVEEFIQLPDAPSLYGALKALPKPLVDLTKQMELEGYNERVHQIMKRLDRNIAVLQCVEALRLYAGTSEGKFPKELSNITEVDVPLDLITGKPFVYSRTGSKAVLKGPAPKGAGAEEALRYELNLKE